MDCPIRPPHATGRIGQSILPQRAACHASVAALAADAGRPIYRLWDRIGKSASSTMRDSYAPRPHFLPATDARPTSEPCTMRGGELEGFQKLDQGIAIR